jgi:hypothetical protein
MDASSFGVGNPEVASRNVIHLVHPAASKKDAFSIRRNVRASDGLHLHVTLCVKKPVILFLCGLKDADKNEKKKTQNR